MPYYKEASATFGYNFTHSGKRMLTKEEVSNLIIDVTEQPIERPKQGQEAYYSGKKKQHTVKKEIRIDQDGTIVHVSATYPGKVHDFAIFKQEPHPPMMSLYSQILATRD